MVKKLEHRKYYPPFCLVYSYFRAKAGCEEEGVSIFSLWAALGGRRAG